MNTKKSDRITSSIANAESGAKMKIISRNEITVKRKGMCYEPPNVQ